MKEEGEGERGVGVAGRADPQGSHREQGRHSVGAERAERPSDLEHAVDQGLHMRSTPRILMEVP